MHVRDFPLKLKQQLEDDDSGCFTGYASTYDDEPDLQNDIIQRGAFSQAIRQQGKGFPLLWSHQQNEPIGVGRVEDSAAGLIVNGKMVMADPVAQRVHAHMKAGSIKGLSIGFTVPRGEGKTAYRDDGSRVLKEIHLHEISLVAVPANPKAIVASVKTLDDVRFALKSLRNDQVMDGTLEQLLEIDGELKRLLVGHDPEQVKRETLRELHDFAAALRKLAA
jgi:HK97 family phage prohead protease